MSFEFQDELQLGNAVYTIDTYPLAPYLAALPTRPSVRVTPFNSRGYLARWAIHADVLYLVEISGAAFAGMFADAQGPVMASWFTGVIAAWRGERRYTGWPPRTFHDDEIVLDIVEGVVRREWRLDLCAVPDQTDDELRLSLPVFLWPARLRSPD